MSYASYAVDLKLVVRSADPTELLLAERKAGRLDAEDTDELLRTHITDISEL